VKAGWEVKPLGEVCELVNGKAYKKAELLDRGKYPVLRVGNFFTSDKWFFSDLELEPKKYCDTGDLLYAWSASFGPRIWEGGKSIFHYHIWNVQHPADVMDRKFLYYYFDWDKEKIKAEQGAGATMIHVSKGSMEARALPIPPLEEQKRIVAVLDAAFEGLTRAKENAETNLQNARELFDNTELELFHKHTGDVADTKLGDLADFRNGLNFSKNSSGQTIKIVGVGDFQDHFWMPLEQLKTVTIEGNLSAQDMISEGDILAVRSNGNKELIGRVMLAGSIEEPTSFSGFTIRIRLNADRVSPEFVCYFMKTKAMRKLLTAGGDGANISNLNQQLLSDLTLRVPSIERQKKVVKEAKGLRAAFDDLVTSYRTKLTDIADLRQSLLQKAFAGELT
jgi:type I restriction enzyme S subunit